MTNNPVNQGSPIFPLGEKNEAYQAFFTGQSYLAALTDLPDGSASLANVSFEPGCRNHWHAHLSGYQVLLVTDGAGFYQQEGRPAQPLKAGDVVVIPEGVKHWHGATKDSWFSHLVITAGETKWYDAVGQEDYLRAHEGVRDKG